MHYGYAAGMASPEVARLARRVDAQDDTVRALSDTVLDIKETVDGHTEALAAIQQAVDQHTEALAAIQQTQGQQGAMLVEVLTALRGGAGQPDPAE